MVVIFLPSAALTGMTHERTGLPSICTVHAPHCAMPQPYLVPVKPSTSRNTHNSGVPPSTSTSCDAPLTVMVKTMVSSFSSAPFQGSGCSHRTFLKLGQHPNHTLD